MQRTFAIARGTLRILLSRYLGCAAREIRFCYGNRGKPSLAGTPRLQFNMSHSGAMALFAFTLDCAIGVDIEQIRPIQDMNDIAARFFAPDETASLMSLAASERERAFFRCWTRKEAFIKATGDGLSTPLDSFSVTLDPGDAARFVRLPADAEALGAWSVHDLVVAPDYAAAAAYPDSARTITVVPLTHPATLLELV
jgi:4'-phosphopantetheinyl transferase